MLRDGARTRSAVPKVLVIGGLDPSGGAGVLIDAFVVANFGAFPYVAISAITAQNSGGVASASPVDPELVARQIDAVLAEGGISAVKTGMIPTMEVAEAVIEKVRDLGIPVVIDPVLRASDGTPLFRGDLSEYASRFASKATILTPNVPEAEALSGHRVSGESDMEKAGRALMTMGADWVFLKGGHLEGEAVDLLMGPGSKRAYRVKKEPEAMRGTGCTLAASIAALLAAGTEIEIAVSMARDFVAREMKSSEAIGLGGRQAPLHKSRFCD